jgi:[glutamine synthetase] adenylyltransferase / [glutamine synthetase]-adenylyl-L-tyrosine phosphorylase
VTGPDQLEPANPPDIRFLDADAAVRNLARVCELVPDGVYQSFLALLPASPSPDATVNQFQRLAEMASPELLRLLHRHRSLVHYAIVVFGHSPWLGETLTQNVDLFYDFATERTFGHTHSREDFEQNFARMRSRSLETDIAALLARFKRREYVRIMLRDVLGIATLAESTAEISALSDVLIEQALQEVQVQLQRRFGAPQRRDAKGSLLDSRFAVLALGKLGGNELNYSSDIDLLYLYDGGDDPAEAEISNREYFIRLAQQLTELLSRHTREGPVFRIDLRLRPQGSEGEPAVPLSHAVHYYSHVAHDWELQAMIKARHVAGDIGLARELVRAVQPYVYRPELNFLAIKTALEARERIGSHRRKSLLKEVSHGGIDVKLDRGGIRDIEFLVQCLQRVYGGSESWLRSRGTLFALQKLHDKEHISGKDFHNLTNAYEFLRNLEHRLQMRQGQQTHRLPQSRDELRRLACSMTREGSAPPAAEEFLMHIQRRMAAVQEIYQRVIYREQSQDEDSDDFQLNTPIAATPENTYSQMMQRLAADSPRLREIASRTVLSQHARRNLDRFLSSSGTTSERYGAVLHSPDAVERALTIFEYSEFLTDILVRHPEDVSLVSEIVEPPSSSEADLFTWESAVPQPAEDHILDYVARGNVDRTEALAILRQQYRRRLFLAGARDLFQHREVFHSLKDNTDAADSAIRAALEINGTPDGFAVMALGRMGTSEFDLLSDADVLFVCENHSSRAAMSRTAELLMEALTAYTRDGSVFPVDTRLRPHGREGELIVTPAQLEMYCKDEAQAWEALTYVKLRHVAGDRELSNQILQVVQEGVAAMAEKPEFAADLADVRKRLERSEPGLNLKTGAGGSYDIDYLAGALQAKHGLWLVGNLPERLRRLCEQQVISPGECEELTENARYLRTVEHVVRLVSGRARKWLPVADHPRRAVQKLVWSVLGGSDNFDPEMRLVEVMQRTRSLYWKHLGP